MKSFEELDWNHSFSRESRSWVSTVNLRHKKRHCLWCTLNPHRTWLPSLSSALLKELPLSQPCSAKHTLSMFVPLPSVWTVLQIGNVIEQIRMASSLVTSHPVHFWFFLSKLEDYTYGWLRDHLLSFRTESLIFNTYLLSKVILLPVISGIFLQLHLL